MNYETHACICVSEPITLLYRTWRRYEIPLETLPFAKYEKPISYYASADLDDHGHASSVQRENNNKDNYNRRQQGCDAKKWLEYSKPCVEEA